MDATVQFSHTKAASWLKLPSVDGKFSFQFPYLPAMPGE
jgi:hypothetical protein